MSGSATDSGTIVCAAKCITVSMSWLSKTLIEQGGITRITDHEFAGGHRLFKTGREVVQRNDFLTGAAELTHDVAADVPGAAGNKNPAVAH